jgi:hypothetical protein
MFQVRVFPALAGEEEPLAPAVVSAEIRGGQELSFPLRWPAELELPAGPCWLIHTVVLSPGQFPTEQLLELVLTPETGALDGEDPDA